MKVLRGSLRAGKIELYCLNEKRELWIQRARGRAHSPRLPKVPLCAGDFGGEGMGEESNGWSASLEKRRTEGGEWN